MVMAETSKHSAEFLPFLLFETGNDEHTLSHFNGPMEALVVVAAYPEVVAGDVIEPLGRVVKHRHLMVEGEGDAATVSHLLNEKDVVGAKDFPS